MWVLFFLTVAVVAAFLYVPGYLALRGFGVARTLAFSFAPLIGVAGYAVLGIAYEAAGIWSSWASQAVPFALLELVVFAVLRMRGRRASACFGLTDYGCARPRGRVSYDAACLVGYLLFSVVFAGVLFVWYLGFPDSYAQQYDNISHLGKVRVFVESGVWSSLSTSLYSPADAVINPLPGSGFYPAAWHSVAALAASSTGVSPAAAENVANFVFTAMVLPSGVFSFVRVAFDGCKSILPFGGVCALLFSGFPWMLIHFGPLYPNLAAFCLIPAAAAVFLLLFQKSCSLGQRVGLLALLVVAIVALVLAQPNAVFTLGVLLAPFCVWRISRIPQRMGATGRRLDVLRLAFGAAAVCVAVAVWLLLYKAPFLQSVVQYTWPPSDKMDEVLFGVLLTGFKAKGSQVVLAVLVVVGAVAALRESRFRWLFFAYVLACVIYCVNDCSGGELKHVFGGFWYTDPWRCGAMASLTGIFLATLGLWSVWRGALKVLDRVSGERRTRLVSAGAAVALACCAVLGATFPGVGLAGFQDGKIAFHSVLNGLHREASTSPIYDEAEQAFVQEVKQVLPSDALVINVPDDGSMFAFPADGLRTYYRYTRTYGKSDEVPESAVIRGRLCRIAEDESVQQAVRSVGAQYVLQLDQGQPGVERNYMFTYDSGKNWRGIDAIRDDTPGFEVVLARDDMRLYRITAV